LGSLALKRFKGITLRSSPAGPRLVAFRLSGPPLAQNKVADLNLFVCNFVRRDKSSGAGGEVAVYVADNIQYYRLKEVDRNDFDVLWISLRPKQLPRPIHFLLVAARLLPSVSVQG
jgi:hypothetical protein